MSNGVGCVGFTCFTEGGFGSQLFSPYRFREGQACSDLFIGLVAFPLL